MPHAITKTFKFEAAHSLPHLPKGHKCREIHGHSYTVTVEATSDTLSIHGFVVDYAIISEKMAPLIEAVDHKNLNNIMECTTAESLALWFYERINLPSVTKVTVCETRNTSASYSQ
jgi:6-pyruvoyltetrahydropterin/6-carboxytetrahydropterin synthase